MSEEDYTDLRKDLESRSWATYTYEEKLAWLYMFVLNENVLRDDNNVLSLESGEYFSKLNLDFMAQCEKNLLPEASKLYVRNCINSVSAYTYKGLTPEQINTPQTTENYYKNVLMFPVEERARCMYWSFKGERA